MAGRVHPRENPMFSSCFSKNGYILIIDKKRGLPGNGKSPEKGNGEASLPRRCVESLIALGG